MLEKNFEQKASKEEREGNFLKIKKIVKRWSNPDEETKKLHVNFQKKNEEIIQKSPDSNLKQVFKISCKISQAVMEHPDLIKKNLENIA